MKKEVEKMPQIHSSRASSESSPKYAIKKKVKYSLNPSACARKKQLLTLKITGGRTR